MPLANPISKETFDEFENMILVEGDPDNPKTQALQDKLDALSSASRGFIKFLEKDRLRQEGEKLRLKEKAEKLRDENHELQERITHLDRQIRYGGYKRTQAADDKLAKWQAAIDRNKLEINRLVKEASQGVHGFDGMVMQAIREAPSNLVPVEHDPISSSAAGAVEFNKLIGQIDAKRAQKFAFANAPAALDEKFPRSDALIDKIADKGKPNVAPLDRRFRKKFDSPYVLEPSTADVAFKLDYYSGAEHGRPIIDMQALFFWLHRDALKAAVRAEIEAHHNAETAVTNAERNAAMAKLDDEMSTLYYEAGAYARHAASQGVAVRFPYGFPALAMVGLKTAT